MESHPDPLAHVCLAGRDVSGDWPLIRTLTPDHHVTLVEQVEGLCDGPLLSTASVLVLDCAGRESAVLSVLSDVRRRHPVLCVLLVDGGLSQREVAGAFQQGVRDYFPAPYDKHLLGERVRFLCARTEPREAPGGG